MIFLKFYVVFSILTIASCDMFIDMVQDEGFLPETHYTTTDDGYILRIHRILPKVVSENPKAMFFMHGLFEDSVSYIIHPNKRSAGYYFSDLGYDVWIGNARGNTYSRNHTTLSPDGQDFWQFSFHEIGISDLAAMIDYILLKTNQTKLIYTGHSQGVTSVFILLSERPEYNDKIEIVHAMTPPIIFKHNKPGLQTLVDLKDDIESYIISRGYYELFPYEAASKNLKPFVEYCLFPFLNVLCKGLIDSLMGRTSAKNWRNRTPLDYVINLPAGVSYRQLFHYLQLGKSGVFQKYDHDRETNLKLYGSESVPEYNLSNIQTKIHIIYGTNDGLVAQENIPLLLEKIKKSVVAVTKMKYYNHMDFLYSVHVNEVQKVILKNS